MDIGAVFALTSVGVFVAVSVALGLCCCRCIFGMNLFGKSLNICSFLMRAAITMTYLSILTFFFYFMIRKVFHLGKEDYILPYLWAGLMRH